tara:strand:+ start:362 stop:904 length:543 start_codon:yes stop_codon:yes gene_type:complete
MSIYDFNSNNLLNWLTAFALFEIPMSLFYLSISSKNDTITNWYSGKDINIWNVIIQDSLYVICGIIITLRIFNYLTKNNIVSKNFYIFILVFICIQIIGDLLFSLIIINWPKNYTSYWIKYFQNYIKKSGFYALFGDTLYIITWSLTFYFVAKYIKSFDIKIFILFLFLFFVSAYSVKGK